MFIFLTGSFRVVALAWVSCPPLDALQVCELDQETDGEELEDAAKDLSGYETIPILFIGGHAVGTCDGELPIAVGQQNCQKSMQHPVCLAFRRFGSLVPSWFTR